MSKRFPLPLVLLAGSLLLSSPLLAAEKGSISLLGMAKKEGLTSTKLILHFSELPEFVPSSSGQRVDISLSGVRLSPRVKRLPEDETVVKILLAQKQRELLVSFLLRRPPVQLVSKSYRDPARIELDLYWEGTQGARPAIAFRIEGMPSRKGGGKGPLETGSPWQGRWLEFFQQYRTPWQLSPALRYTLPGLPPLSEAEAHPKLQPLLQLAAEKQWRQLLRLPQAEGLPEPAESLRELLLVEALLRTGGLEAAQSRLQQLAGQESAARNRVDYLTAFSQAAARQPFQAQLTLAELLPRLSETSSLRGPALLLAAETALSTGQDRAALERLNQPDLAWPEQLQLLVQLRRADAQAGLGEAATAMTAYRELMEVPGLLDQYLFSRNRAAESAFALEDYGNAMTLYQQLAELLVDEADHGLALFAAAAAAYAGEYVDWGLIWLQKVRTELEEGEGADRAGLRLQDHQVLSGGDRELAEAVQEYGELARRARLRQLREEAAFKRLLCLHLLGDHEESVTGLMKFRRDFASGRLKREADALLLEQLPPLVRQRLADGDDLQAVVLVEQNRKLLLRGGVDQDLLDELAEAFARLGLYQRASRVLLYLYDQALDEREREPYYLPLAGNYLQREEYMAASDYARNYLERYPQGRDRGALYGILLDALDRQGLHEELLAQLTRKDRPGSPELEIRVARIYWGQGKLQECVRSLEKARQLAGSLAVKEMALLAESYYRLRRNRESLALYRPLQQQPELAAQARYRSAQLLLRQGKRGQGLKLLRQLVEENSSPAWVQLARDLLIQEM